MQHQTIYVKPIADHYSATPVNFKKQASYRLVSIWETFGYVIDDGGVITPIPLSKMIVVKMEEGYKPYTNTSLEEEQEKPQKQKRKEPAKDEREDESPE